MTKESDQGACAVPLTEQMRSVDKDWREMREVGPCAHRNVPYGRMLHEAADEIDRLRGALQVIAGRNTAEGAAAREALGTSREPECCLAAGCGKPPMRASFCEEHNAQVPRDELKSNPPQPTGCTHAKMRCERCGEAFSRQDGVQ